MPRLKYAAGTLVLVLFLAAVLLMRSIVTMRDLEDWWNGPVARGELNRATELEFDASLAGFTKTPGGVQDIPSAYLHNIDVDLRSYRIVVYSKHGSRVFVVFEADGRSRTIIPDF